MKRVTSKPHDLLACLADASRFRLVSALTRGERCVTELAHDVGLSQSCTTRHLQALKLVGVVSAQRQGKRVVYGLRSDVPRVSSLLSWAMGAAGARLEATRVATRSARSGASRAGRSSRILSASSRAARVMSRPSVPTVETPSGVPPAEPEPVAIDLEPPAEPAVREPETRRPAHRPARPGDIEDFLL
jgi:DNA-binding transcriptional ArsR family regulator